MILKDSQCSEVYCLYIQKFVRTAEFGALIDAPLTEPENFPRGVEDSDHINDGVADVVVVAPERT